MLRRHLVDSLVNVDRSLVSAGSHSEPDDFAFECFVTRGHGGSGAASLTPQAQRGSLVGPTLQSRSAECTATLWRHFAHYP